MSSDLDLSTPDPDGGSDPAPSVVGAVFAVDAASRRVQVGVRGVAVWLPAQPGRYRVVAAGTSSSPGLARVLISSRTARPVLVLGPVDPDPPVLTGTITATTSSPPTATVTLRGISVTVPAIPSTYANGSQAWIMLDDWGTPALCLGPTTQAADPTPPPPTPPPSGGTVQVSTTVGPTWSSSWSAKRGGWNDGGRWWNGDRYGGGPTLYQGSTSAGTGSGVLTGLATYGDQLVNLGAVSIDDVKVANRNVGLASGSPAVTVQGSPHGSEPAGAPSHSGDTASGMDTWLPLPASVREAMRTGAVKGLALVGGSYSACAGAGNGDGMVLAVTYTRAA